MKSIIKTIIIAIIFGAIAGALTTFAVLNFQSKPKAKLITDFYDTENAVHVSPIV